MNNLSEGSRRKFLKKSISGGAALSAIPVMGFGMTPETIKQTQPYIAKPVPRLPCSIFMSAGLDENFEKEVRAISPRIALQQDLEGPDRKNALELADIHFGQIRQEDLSLAKNLSLVQSVSAGVEHQLYPEFVQSNVLLSNAKGCYAPAIAEHTIGLLFSLTRKIGGQIRNMSQHQWGGSGDQIEMKNLTMGIVGFGGIGRQIARRARAMDMRIVAADIQGFYREQIGDVCDEMLHIDEGGLEKLLEQSDVVVSAAPHTPRSEGMFAAEQFQQMKPGVFFINVSRGKLVDTDALVAALKSGQVAGAGLDVTNPEPLPEDHPLWDFDNVTITSHISGRSQHSWERLQSVFVENVRRYVYGMEMVNLVDKQAGF
jgi:phosphoglycerate dehydrogenase-like enzyme